MKELENIALGLLCGECDLDPEDYCPGLRIDAEEALRAVAAAPAPQLQPIATAPKDGTEIVVWNGSFWVARWSPRGTWDDGDYRDDIIEVTHWVPLPAVPEQP